MPLMPVQTWPPDPPKPTPPARTVAVPGRGEFFLRDTGESDPTRPTVMLLHGWMATADLNWLGAYDALSEAGYRVIAIDHRGHGRGLRQAEPFRLADCAADAAAVLRQLHAGPAVVVGYSMGGAIAQLVGRDHADVVTGLVLSGTAQHWQDPATKRYWRMMGVVGLGLSVAPRMLLGRAFRGQGIQDGPRTAWLLSELVRGSARDLAEGGRELGRFDSRPWLQQFPFPSAVVITTRDQAVGQRKQRELAAALSADVFEAPIDHLEVSTRTDLYNPPLLDAIAAVRADERSARAPAGRASVR
jgi:3-oxoadipate enol-lactonase